MKRYIKVNGQWIDTLEQQKAGYYYYENEDVIWCLPDETMIDYVVGKLQDESDTPVREPLKEFFKQYPNKGYKTYLKFCELNNIEPIKKSIFRRFKK